MWKDRQLKGGGGALDDGFLEALTLLVCFFPFSAPLSPAGNCGGLQA